MAIIAFCEMDDTEWVDEDLADVRSYTRYTGQSIAVFDAATRRDNPGIDMWLVSTSNADY